MPEDREYTEVRLPTSIQIQASGEATAQLRLAYLLSRYPAISHTFFLKEVLGLRERGVQVNVASINLPDRRRGDLPPVERVEADRTFYVKSGGMFSLLVKVLTIAVRNPQVTLRGLRAALQLGDWDLKARAFALFYLAEAMLVGDWMRRNALLHLHVHFGGPVATVGMIASKAWQIPWSVTLHGPDEFFDQEAFYLPAKIKSARFVVCISDFCRSQVLRIVPEIGDDRLETVRLGVDCVALQPTDPDSLSIKTEGSPLRLVCTGRLVAAKGHRILLQALAPLVASGIEISCVLIGDGPERPSLETLCVELGIAGQVQFQGALAHRETLAEVARADVFVLASFAEGLPVALMEAMAFGVPCISTTIAAIPELILDGQNGLLVPPANPEALQVALEQMAGNPMLRRQLGKSARATVETRYNLAANLDLLAAQFADRLSGGT